MKKYFCFLMAVVFLLLAFTACKKKQDPGTVNFEFETEAPDSRLPQFKGDIVKLMNNYFLKADIEGRSLWAAGINGNFYLSEPTVAEFSAEWHNIFNKNCTSSLYDCLYEYYQFLKENDYSVKSIEKNAEEVIGRKAHKLVLESDVGETDTYYLDAEYGFCLKKVTSYGKTMFEVTELRIGNVKYDELKWEKVTNNYTGPTETTVYAKPTVVIMQDDETTTKEAVTLS